MDVDLKAAWLIVAAVLVCVRALASLPDWPEVLGWLGLAGFIAVFAWDASELAFA